MSDAGDMAALPFLKTFDASTQQAIAQHGRVVAMPAGAHVFDAGQQAHAFLVVLEGSVRVHLTAENGREIVLYRVEAGESCVLTTSALMDSENYAAEAVCETPVRAVALPKPAFRALMASSEPFRDAVLAAYASRVSDLILTIEETRFQRVDARLAALIAARADGGGLHATHAELATELGTAREVVSRVLKRFERSGAVALTRGVIEIRDRQRLRQHAQGAMQ